MNEKVKKKSENFLLALKSLKKAATGSKKTEVEIAGIIQMFEYTYETGWRLLKAVLRRVLTEAYTAGLIDDEKKWIRMIEDRNLTTHTYRKKTANAVVKRIRTDYLKLFLGLRESFGRRP